VSQIKPEISGVLFNFSEDGLIVTATDGYRIAEKTIKLSNKNKPIKVIIQTRVLQELFRIVSVLQKDSMFTGQESNDVEMYISNTQVVFKHHYFELVSKVISGTYPDYEPVVPKSFTTRAVINTEDFIRGVKASSLFSRTNIFDVVVELNSQDKTVTIKGSAANIGESIVEYEDAKIEGEGSKIILNYKYLLSWLLNITSEEFAIETTASTNPCIIRPATDGTESKYLYVIIPLRQ
jgi:DNA polymerase-3 subunit beta